MLSEEAAGREAEGDVGDSGAPRARAQTTGGHVSTLVTSAEAGRRGWLRGLGSFRE